MGAGEECPPPPAYSPGDSSELQGGPLWNLACVFAPKLVIVFFFLIFIVVQLPLYAFSPRHHLLKRFF